MDAADIAPGEKVSRPRFHGTFATHGFDWPLHAFSETLLLSLLLQEQQARQDINVGLDDEGLDGKSTLAKTQQFARIHRRIGSSPGFPKMPSGNTIPMRPPSSSLSPTLFQLHVAGAQEENGLGASGGRPAILRVASGPMRRGLRIARRHTDRYPGAVSTENCRAQQRQDLACRPRPMRRGLRIAIGGMPSGPRAVVFTGTPSLSYSPFASCSPIVDPNDNLSVLERD